MAFTVTFDQCKALIKTEIHAYQPGVSHLVLYTIVCLIVFSVA